jgi:acetyltransferase-like isoleucine patch superfamily enzyme
LLLVRLTSIRKLTLMYRMNIANFKSIFFKKLRRKSYKLFPNWDGIDVSPTLIMGRSVNINIEKNAFLKIEEDVSIREYCSFLIFSGGRLNIGKKVFFNNYCSINCLGEVSIGEGTLFGESVKLYDHNHVYKKESGLLKVEHAQFKIGKITIGKNCWLGSNVTILNNVDIGDNVIIGANCLIVKSIPSNSIVKQAVNLIVETNSF